MLDATTTAAELTIDDMRAAHERIKPYIHNTPVLTSSYLNELTGAELFFKCENFQKVAPSRCAVRRMPCSACRTRRPRRASARTARAITRCPCLTRQVAGAFPVTW